MNHNNIAKNNSWEMSARNNSDMARWALSGLSSYLKQVKGIDTIFIIDQIKDSPRPFSARLYFNDNNETRIIRLIKTFDSFGNNYETLSDMFDEIRMFVDGVAMGSLSNDEECIDFSSFGCTDD